jgi:hypothetical protein
VAYQVLGRSSRRSREGTADRLDPEPLRVLVDVGDQRHCGRSNSDAKKADALEDLVRPAQLPVLPLELDQPGPLVGHQTRRVAAVDTSPLHPVPRRVRHDPELLTTRRQAAWTLSHSQ